jgi:UDP-N-acetylmuramoylalanine--D-glutamate ligase
MVDTAFRAKIPTSRISSAELAGKRVLVLGLGVSGIAAARLALSLGAACHALDGGNGEALAAVAAELRELGSEVTLGWESESALPAADLIVVSPGIIPRSPLGCQAWGAGVPVVSELEFGFRYCSCPVLAITGTNGKTTTVELTTHLLAACGLRVRAAGNIGLPLAACAAESAELDALVVEVSSFQLEAVDEFRPAVAALLNVTPDHYDRHGGPAPYLEAKLALFRRMDDAGTMVLRRDLGDVPEVRAMLAARSGQPRFFAASPSPDCAFYAADGGLYECRDGVAERLADVAELALPGTHNVENALAALAVVRAAGYCPVRAARALGGFRPSRHRLELVAERDGVRYINDSKATNVDALCRALESLAQSTPGRRILLLAGGVDKDIGFSMALPWLEKQVKEAFLIGSCKGRLAKQWQGVVSCREFPTFEEAVAAASAAAVPGDVVLLSPGCASQDMFQNYAHRGDQFRALVERRAGE